MSKLFGYLKVLSSLQQKLLSEFVSAVAKENVSYNLTGCGDEEIIMQNLVYRSILPLQSLNVPRGTFAADMGTGAGVPGIPLAIMFPNIRWYLIDSNAKKTAFVRSFIKHSGISNAEVLTARAEELGRSVEFRDKFGFITSRAMADAYTCGELGAPMLGIGGFLYLYSDLRYEVLPPAVTAHIAECSLSNVPYEKRCAIGIAENGLLFEKMEAVKDIFPRRFSAIRREADKAKN